MSVHFFFMLVMMSGCDHNDQFCAYMFLYSKYHIQEFQHGLQHPWHQTLELASETHASSLVNIQPENLLSESFEVCVVSYTAVAHV